MKRFTGALTLCVTLAVQGCMASTLVLHVMADRSGQAIITMRMYESGVKAFDSLFPESPKQPPTLDEMLPPLTEGMLEGEFGTRVRIASTKLEKASDGGTRTTTVDFDDVTKLRLVFPPMVMSGVGGGMHGGLSMNGLDEPAVITFAMKPHENGDRLLLVTMPDNRMQPEPNPPVTSFETNSIEEQKIKAAIKKMSLRFFVELDRPLLRTNAPATRGNRATILDLDLDTLITSLDEGKARHLMSPGSMQEMLWQLADLPGAIVPAEHEVFLEFEPPPVQAQPPAAPARGGTQAPPDTEIYLASMKTVNGTIEFGPAIDITNHPGYDNQPFFTPDGKSVLFTSMRGAPAASGSAPQTDIYRFDIGSSTPGGITQITNTPESEYSPTVTPAGNLSVIRVEADGTQRLWQFTADGRDPRVVLEKVKPVGYHAWADDHTLALFVLGQPATLQLADTRTGAARVLASDIGRSIQRIPGQTAGAISFVQHDRTAAGQVTLTIKALDPVTGAISTLTPAVEGSTEADTAWTPDGTLLMVKGTTLYAWKPGFSGWKDLLSLPRLSLSGVTRLAVSPRGDYLALVGSPRPGG